MTPMTAPIAPPGPVELAFSVLLVTTLSWINQCFIINFWFTELSILTKLYIRLFNESCLPLTTLMWATSASFPGKVFWPKTISSVSSECLGYLYLSIFISWDCVIVVTITCLWQNNDRCQEGESEIKVNDLSRTAFLLTSQLKLNVQCKVSSRN